jgi:Rhodopirellula transposase DDE domain
VIVSLIAGTTTRKGLKVHAEIDARSYPAGIKVQDGEMGQINLRREAFHGEWNYEIPPRQ